MNELIWMPNWKIRLLGDHAVQFFLPPVMHPSTSKEIKNLNDFVVSNQYSEIKDSIPSYHSLTLVYDIELLNDPASFANTILENYFAQNKNMLKTCNKILDIPVCYDVALGIDLASMSLQLNLSINEIIQIHCSTIYQVYCLGFMPGFAYMGEVPKKIQVVRHHKPRQNIPAGSVGIAGAQTGIYPMQSPGGWQIIGKTPLKIFDALPTILAKFKMGDQVQFYPISMSEFNSLNQYEN